MTPALRVALLAAAVAAAAGAVHAGDEPVPAFGASSQDLWIPAAAFTPQNGTGSGQFINRGGHYYSVLGAGNGRFAAAVHLEAGARVTRFECDVFDNSMFVVLATLMRNEGTGTAPAVDLPLAQASSTGPGYQTSGQDLAYTVQTRQGQARIFHWIALQMQADDPNTMFRGCRIAWNRQVSPAPASATFADVPAGHPLHRFVEALSAAAITGGCGGGNFCPDEPLTRGQMAVFLAVALGLHFPY